MRKWLSIASLIVLVALGLVWWTWPQPVVEPTVKGRTASAWIKALADSTEKDEARKNLADLGPVGIPYIVAAFRHAGSFSATAQSKLFEISPAMRKLLSKPFPWNYVREDLAVILGDVGKAHLHSNPTGDAPATPEIQLAVEALVSGVEKGDRNFRSLCAQALWGFGPNARPATTALLGMFEKGEMAERRLVCQALGRIGVDGALALPVATALTDALRSSDINLKVAAIQALGGLDAAGKMAVPNLVRFLDDARPEIRQSALQALARIGNPPVEIRPRIAEFAKDGDDYTRAGAAIALLRMNPHDAFASNIVINCMAPEMPRTVRSSTLYLILGMHREAVIFTDPLKKLSDDEDRIVSMWSKQALKEIGAKAR